MKILLAGAFISERHEPTWSRALRELGHDVTEFHFGKYVNRASILDRLQNRFVFGPLLRRANDDLLALARQVGPEAFIAYRALLMYPKTARRLRAATGAILASYQNDNVFGGLEGKAYWRLFRRAIPEYDVHFAFRHSDVSNYLREGVPRAVLLRRHYRPWVHRRLSPGEAAGWESDICFVGHCEADHRLDYMDRLMRSVSASYRLNGFAWMRHAQGRAWKGMDTPDVEEGDYVRALNGTKIALAFLSTLNQDTYTMRHFEIPACGTFMLSQRTDDLLTLYEEDKEAAFFSSADELIDKARFYLAHADARRRIAEAGFRRCTTSGYDIFTRMRLVVSTLEQIRSSTISGRTPAPV